MRVVSVKFKDDEHAAVERMARLLGKPVSRWIRDVLAERIAGTEPKDAPVTDDKFSITVMPLEEYIKAALPDAPDGPQPIAVEQTNPQGDSLTSELPIDLTTEALRGVIENERVRQDEQAKAATFLEGVKPNPLRWVCRCGQASLLEICSRCHARKP